MSRLSIKGWCVLAIGVIGIALVGYHLFARKSIPPHQGDGRFEDLSRRVGPFWLPGYSITLPEFDLTNEHETSFRVANLADINAKCMVYFGFHDAEYAIDWERATIGEISIEVSDSSGQSVVKINGAPRDFIWYGFGDPYLLYMLNQSSFYPAPEEHYVVRLSYRPDPVLKSRKGFVFLKCGGHK